MAMHTTKVVVGLVAGLALLVGAGRAVGEERPDVNLKPLLAKVREVVRKHYPEAEVGLVGKVIHFESNVRKFWIHDASLTGEWGDAHEELGPKKGGIYGDIELIEGEYMGMMAEVPQTIDEHYFLLLLMAPSSRKLDCHLWIRLKYPRGASKEFLEEFQKVVDGFEELVTVKGKE